MMEVVIGVLVRLRPDVIILGALPEATESQNVSLLHMKTARIVLVPKTV